MSVSEIYFLAGTAYVLAGVAALVRSSAHRGFEATFPCGLLPGLCALALWPAMLLYGWACVAANGWRARR